MSGKSENGKVYYGIDIGAPSKGDGFYAVKWDGEKITHCDKFITYGGYEVEELKKWNATIDEIAEDAKKHEVHIALEAPLFGFSNENMWKPRFEIKVRNNNKKTTLKEYPYYTSAGGATGFIAQIFLSHLKNKTDTSKLKNIYLYESYVSGFNGTESKTDQRRVKYNECSPSKIT